MSKKVEPKVCPKCGGCSWLSTTKGEMCKGCGYVQGEAPFLPTPEKEE
jgi:transcription initiation factor TFIIIB Brf1 subunit/transcription initiation factor TFIIB